MCWHRKEKGPGSVSAGEVAAAAEQEARFSPDAVIPFGIARLKNKRSESLVCRTKHCKHPDRNVRDGSRRLKNVRRT